MVWFGAPLFPVYFLWWRRIWLFIVLRPEGNYCVLAPCGEIVLCLALSGWNPGLFILACWEEKEIDYWMTCMTLAEEEKFLLFFAFAENITEKLYCQFFLSARIRVDCYFLLLGKEHDWSPLALNPEAHTFISVHLFSETFSNGCSDSRIQDNNWNWSI